MCAYTASHPRPSLAPLLKRIGSAAARQAARMPNTWINPLRAFNAECYPPLVSAVRAIAPNHYQVLNGNWGPQSTVVHDMIRYDISDIGETLCDLWLSEISKVKETYNLSRSYEYFTDDEYERLVLLGGGR